MSTEEIIDQTLLEQKKTKRFLLFATFTLIVIFPLSFKLSSTITFSFLFLLSQPSQLHLIAAIFIPLSILAVPSTILLSVWNMWSKYKENNYRQARRSFSWPFYMLLIVFILNAGSFFGMVYLIEYGGYFNSLKIPSKSSHSGWIEYLYSTDSLYSTK